MNEFGSMLQRFRLRTRDHHTGRPLSQERLADFVAERLGMDSLSGATISNWERGRYQIHKDDRSTLIALLQVLHEYDGIKSALEAARWLEAGNYRPLDMTERKSIHAQWGEDESLVAKLPALEASLPPSTYLQLFGREAAVHTLQEQLTDPQGPGVIFICGLGGIGKTALADAVTRSVLAENRFVRIVWLPVGSIVTQEEPEEAALLLLALMVNVLSGHSATESDPLRRLAQIRYILSAQPHLLVLDDLPSVINSAGLFAQLYAFSGTSRFVITGRRQPPPEANVYLYSMKALAQQDAVQLLHCYAGMSATNVLTTETKETLTAISQVVGGHPLALRLAARLSLSYSSAWLIAGWQRDQQGQIARLYTDIYSRLWQALEEDQQQLLGAMLLASQTGARPEHLQSISGLTETAFWPAVTALVERSLLEPRGTLQKRRYGVHQLTSQFLRNRLHHSEVDKGWHTKHILANLHYWHKITAAIGEAEWHFLAEERYNIYQAITVSLALQSEEQASVIQPAWLSAARCLFFFCQQRGYWQEWLPVLKQLVSASEGMYRAELLNQLGVLYQLGHRLPDAVATHKEALMLTMRLEDEQGIGHSAANLGRAYYRQRKFAAATERATQALGIFTQREPNGREVASTLELLGLAARAQGNYRRAERYLGESVQHWRKLNRPRELARTLNNLGNTLQANDSPQAALDCFSEAKAALAETDSEMDRVMVALSEGTLYFELGDIAQAGAAFRAIDLNFLRRIGHLLYLGLSLNNLGNVCLRENNYNGAETFLGQAVEVWQAADETVQLANTSKTLGDAFFAQHRLEKAREMYERTAMLLQQHPNDFWAAKLAQELEEAKNQFSDE